MKARPGAELLSRVPHMSWMGHPVLPQGSCSQGGSGAGGSQRPPEACTLPAPFAIDHRSWAWPGKMGQWSGLSQLGA